MFIDISTDYTNTQLCPQNDIIIQIEAKRIKNVAEYTHTNTFWGVMDPSYTIEAKRTIEPTSESLKKAMFRMSSRGISKSLK